MFIKLVEEQLDKMSETEKDKWILTQAKLLEESMQQGFLMSLSNEKKIIYMPSQREIEEFCEKVGKEDLTDFFIYLLIDAEEKKDKDRYKKLYSSAKRRRHVDITCIDKALSSLREEIKENTVIGKAPKK